MYGLRLCQYPNNELRLTAYPIRSRRFFYEDENENDSHTDDLFSETHDRAQEVEPQSSPLSLPPNSELSPKPGFGGLPPPSRFSLYGRRTIMRSAGALEKSGYQTQNTIFLTGTLPGSTYASMEAMASWSAYLVDRLKSWMSKFAKNRMEFYVWELQKRGALHLHYCVALGDGFTGQRIIEGFHKEWRKLILRVGEKAGVDMFERWQGGTWRGNQAHPRTDAQRTRKSVAAYMAKYCTKGNGNNVIVGNSPSRWYGVSRPLLGLSRSLTSEKEYVCTNINSSKKKAEELMSVMETNCEKVHSYSSKCKTFQIKVGYHLPEHFQEIKSVLFGEEPMQIYELRDGSHVKNNLQLRNRLMFTASILPRVESTKVLFQPLDEFIAEAGSVLTEFQIEKLMGLLFKISMLDSQFSIYGMESQCAPEVLSRVSRVTHQTLQLLKNQYSALYASAPAEVEYPSFPPQSATFVQLDIFGAVKIERIPWYDQEAGDKPV